MRVRKGLVAIAAGAILATTGAAYSAPIHRYYGDDDDRQSRMGEAQEERGERLIRQGEELERRGYWRQGEQMEQRGRQLLREGERHERLGRWEERHDR
jgi:hypothetical protein